MIQRVSNSRIGKFKACRRAYFLRYIEGLEPQSVSPALSLGRMVHGGIARLLKPSLAVEEVSDSADASLAACMVQAWSKAWPALPEILAVEEPFEVRVGKGRRFIGVWDAVIRDAERIWVLEHKTTTGYDGKYLDNLLRDEQATGYVYAARERFGATVAGVIYTIIEKPSIRLKKEETPEEFDKRRAAWYAEEERVHVQRVYRTAEHLAAWKEDTDRVMADMRRAEREGAFYPSPSACAGSYFGCEYAGLCPLDTPEAREGLFIHREDR